MDFTTRLSVTIAGRLVQTVHEVTAKYDGAHIGSTCDIIVPLNCRIAYSPGSHETLTAYPQTQFKAGDPVQVLASYPNTGLPSINIFTGFLFEFKEGTPCVIRCIDYLPLLGHMQNLHAGSITLKNLITGILQGTGVSLILPTIDFTLVDITFRTISPWGILEWIKKCLGLNIALTGDQLYCNLASNTVNVVKFRSDRNLYGCNLQQPDTIWQGYRVKAWFVNEDGTKNSFEVGDTAGHLTEVYFYKVQDHSLYQQLASEALVKVRQRKFNGTVAGYLYPEVKLFDKIEYTDIRYPSRSGNYVCTGITYTLSDAGFHKEMKWAYLTDFIGLQASAINN